ncbi:MAG: glycosyltransferase family 39 protein [Saprospirales bacterium]|nr:glycosyltransferase family 39 protein [Saprospirales bacterium]
MALALNLLLRSCNIYQGWGGDYAGYLGQARSVVESRPITDGNYIYNPAMPHLAPPAYPMGYPLMLAPLYAWFGLDMLVFSRFSAFTWWLAGVALFFFLRREFSTLPALVTSVFFLFNPYYFAGKNLVLPDFIFAVWVLAAIYWYNYRDRHRYPNALWCGLWVGLAWVTRANGIVLLLAFVADTALSYLYTVWTQRRWLPEIKQMRFLAIAAAVAVLVQVLVHGVLFHLPESGSYFDQMNRGAFGSARINSYFNQLLVQVLHYFQLEPEMTFFRIKNEDVAVQIGGALAIGLIILGMLRPGSPAARFYLLVVCLFGVLLAVWPLVQTLRYLLPVMCLMAYFLLRGLQAVDFQAHWVANSLKWLAVPLLFYGAYWHIDLGLHKGLRNADIGAPEYWNNQEAFRYIRENSPPGARFAASHPLIFGLYADRKCVRWSNFADARQIWVDFKQFEIDYLLVNNWVDSGDAGLQQFLKDRAGALQKIWHNERNVLFKIDRSSQ